MHETFLHLDHRPFPLPHSSWVIGQTWTDLLFAHWPVPAKVIKCFLPPSLQIDLFNGAAWLGIVPFKVSGMHFYRLPPIPYLRSFLQLNVRTYVTYKGVPGVYFFSLDVNHLPSVFGARLLYSLPFRLAKMAASVDGGCHFQSIYSSEKKQEQFDIFYRSISVPYIAEEGTFEHWALERYCLFTERRKKLYRGDIHHTRWLIQKAEATIHCHTVAAFLKRKYFQQQPVLHFSQVKKAFFWPLEQVWE